MRLHYDVAYHVQARVHECTTRAPQSAQVGTNHSDSNLVVDEEARVQHPKLREATATTKGTA